MTLVARPSKHAQPKAKQSKSKAQDEQVMGTNNSSIVSKRSVERLYYPHEPHFFRFFVRKFQRRAPLINRGYYLRLHVIDVTVREFLGRWTDKKKVVVNLGCGSDVLPWQCMTRYPEHCTDALFVDVDFPDLMRRKRETVLSTPELRAPLTSLGTSDSSPILLTSDQYHQVGCDLSRLDVLEASLSSIADPSNCCFLFVAEVSITYMETAAADALVQWSSSLGDSDFCLLEQLLPDGPQHPFARMMNSHFEKLNTPLKSVHRYPTLHDQAARFSSRGWRSVRARTLWQAWADDAFLTAAERRRLDGLEPFDEWEEFAIFGSHYCLIQASSRDGDPSPNQPPGRQCADVSTTPARMSYREHAGQTGRRRFAAAMALENALGERFVANVMGGGNGSRLSSSDIYGDGEVSDDLALDAHGPAGRMCHAVADIGPGQVLLVGGRASPASPLKDCWLFRRGAARWKRTHDLPAPLYRHSIARLGESSLGLLVGGKTGPSAVFGGCLLFHPEKGWIECSVTGGSYQPVFGAGLVWTHQDATTRHSGFLTGGISTDAVITEQLLRWTVHLADPANPTISFEPVMVPAAPLRQVVSRFGATSLYRDGRLVLVGGVAGDHLLSREEEILRCEAASPCIRSVQRILPELEAVAGEREERPLLVGHSACLSKDGGIDILGGGATCFSFGTFWARGSYAVDLGQSRSNRLPLTLHKTVEMAPRANAGTVTSLSVEGRRAPEIRDVPRVTVRSSEDFQALVRKGQPVIIEGLDLGPCTTRWTMDSLVDKIGPERQVVVHESPSQSMDFNTKNFRYVTKTFAEFAAEVRSGGRLYLRALSADGPADVAANIASDFPVLAREFVLPDELSFVADNLFSSVLRVSGPVNMWLHYDVMANVYCQVHGSKRLLLFPPSDVEQLGFAPGASSSSIDVFSAAAASAGRGPHPRSAALSAGDVLFLPPLWPHAASPTSAVSVAVNAFFRDLGAGYSAGRDVYGNRDLAPYEKGRQDVARIAAAFRKLPRPAREFYLLRLGDELRQKARE